MPQTSLPARRRRRALRGIAARVLRAVTGLAPAVTAVLTLSAVVMPAAAQLGSATASKKPAAMAAVGGDFCGRCLGDLNDDGLLNELDLMVFDQYEAGFPQNLCADFDGDGVVEENDKQYLRFIIFQTPGGACNERCGDVTRGCFTEAVPGDVEAGGCDDPQCCTVVCDNDPLCCTVIWDAGCVTIAENVCVGLEPDTRPDAGDCLCEHGFAAPPADCVRSHAYPGCADTRCASLVCEIDPACCTTGWDEACVEISKRHCQEPCTNRLLRDAVCEIDPACCGEWIVDPDTGQDIYVTDWDAGCATLAALVIFNEPGLQIRAFPANGLLCDPTGLAESRPLDVQLESMQPLLCIVDPVYCSPAGDATFNFGVAQCIAAIERNYPACAELFADGIWDAACVQIADQLCRWPDAADIGLGDCLRVHTGGGCNDGFCTGQVCDLDPTCCETVWDEACVRLAAEACVLVPAAATGSDEVFVLGSSQVRDATGFGCGSSAAGACCYENFTPYCDDAACCQLVCSYDAYCCDVRWDEFCAQLASDGCALLADRCTCGPKLVQFGPPSRSCFEPRLENAQWQTGCADGECCNSVCYIDPFCCEVRWDQICADGALQVCVEICYDQFGAPVPCYPDCGDALAGSCFVEHETPGCDDLQCCQNVCAIDPKCCDEFWDTPCVELAAVSCNECGDIYAGSCLSPNPTPSCADAACCTAVCEDDPFCCSDRWDSGCVAGAAGRRECVSTESCGSPTARGCYLASITPGCSDAGCCATICDTYDPWCCEVRWDAVCAQQAFSFCDPPPSGGTRDPCDARHATPGCNDAQCASAVCAIAGFEYCCLNRWDTACVQAAEAMCIGLYVCPGPGDCEKAHANPMCDDPSCCNAVCTYDPACCRIEWDAGCAALAITTCRVPSGNDWPCPCEGDCFTARDEDDPRPGCDDKSCCATVCRIDELCCTESWDAECASLASFYCASDPTCGAPSSGSCLEATDTPFCDDAFCCTAVCTIDPICCSDRWDSFCVSLAQERCRRGCGIESAGSCFFPHLSPGCSDAECCTTVCELDPICCTTIWDGTCAEEALAECEVPECGEFAAGSCCEPNLSPSCEDKRCCNAVCGEDPFCCDVTWDLECVRMARQSPRCDCGANWDCGDPCAGECCLPNFTPKCNDAACCNAVCDIDSYCCDVEWDLVCATGALETDGCDGPEEACPAPQCGEPDAGDCCFANGTPSCNDETCCDQICNSDPVCCDEAWDSLCAAAAADPDTGCDVCTGGGLECGSGEAGLCTIPHEGPYCNNAECCDAVCLIEYFCCVGDWDEYCVALAEAISICINP